EEEVKPAKGKKKRAAVAEEEELEEEEARPARKPKKRRRYEEEQEEGRVATLTRVPKPKYGRRWLGGMLLGIILAAGGAAAVWYFAPEYLDQIPPSPNAKAKPPAED